MQFSRLIIERTDFVTVAHTVARLNSSDMTVNKSGIGGIGVSHAHKTFAAAAAAAHGIIKQLILLGD
jgi:hypothetical protein